MALGSTSKTRTSGFAEYREEMLPGLLKKGLNKREAVLLCAKQWRELKNSSPKKVSAYEDRADAKNRGEEVRKMPRGSSTRWRVLETQVVPPPEPEGTPEGPAAGVAAEPSPAAEPAVAPVELPAADPASDAKGDEAAEGSAVRFAEAEAPAATSVLSSGRAHGVVRRRQLMTAPKLMLASRR